ncbi:GMC oxidoreductase [Dongia sedimenti]
MFHPTSTCKMGNDRMAVVDPGLKIHELARVRIADSFIHQPS